MKKLFQEFREFVSKGNMIDLAVGIIIGSAFSSVVNSIINNLLMPPLGLLFGDVGFTDLFIILKGGDGLPANATLAMANEAGAVTFNYGQFITDLISFLILALAVFLIIKVVQKLKKEEKVVEEKPTDKTCPFCQENIPVNATRCPFCTSHLDTE